LIKTAEYPEFKSLAALREALSSDAARETALRDGAHNRQRLARAGVLGKTWPVRMSCRRPPPTGTMCGENSKIIHFIRHGQGFHNSLNDLCKVYDIKGRLNPYNIAENFDPPLTEIGRQQARALQPYAKTTSPELVVVSPMSRALMTSNLAYAHLIGTVPFVAHEGCKEKSHGNACDYRRSTDEAKEDFPNVDFSMVVPEDPLLATLHEEDDHEVSQRAYDFMLWLRSRKEKEIVVSTHSAWLFAVFNAVLQCDPPELGEWFANGELRTVQVTFE